MYKYEVNVGKELNNKLDEMIRLKEHENSKSPRTQLVFKKSTLSNVHCISRGHDGKFYAILSDGKVSKFSTIIGEGVVAEESGYIWSKETLGRPTAIKQVVGGFLVFANLNGQALIYKMSSLNSEPIQKYQSATVGNSEFTLRNQMGIRTYHNGFKTLVIAGVYGQGADQRDLLLSTDNGETFKVIKKTKNADSSGPHSHWHDIAFDVYHGFIWCSEGDSEKNRDIYYSDDMGETWYRVQPILTRQPTAIMPFPDRVVFGRDSVRPGFDVLEKPNLEKEYLNPYKLRPLKEFKVNTTAINYYAHSPILNGNEAYVHFSILSKEPRLIMGTGDFGKTWHFLFMSYGDDVSNSTISSLAEIDDEYLYAYGSTAGGTSPIWYSKKPAWV